jgi:hypothetical protein
VNDRRDAVRAFFGSSVEQRSLTSKTPWGSAGAEQRGLRIEPGRERDEPSGQTPIGCLHFGGCGTAEGCPGSARCPSPRAVGSGWERISKGNKAHGRTGYSRPATVVGATDSPVEQRLEVERRVVRAIGKPIAQSGQLAVRRTTRGNGRRATAVETRCGCW